MAQATRRTGGSRSGSGASAVAKAPDVVGSDGRVELVASMLATVQRERVKLEVEQVSNGLADDEPAPGPLLVDDPEAEGGRRLKTVAERRQELNDQERRLIEHYPEEIEAVRKRVAEGGAR